MKSQRKPTLLRELVEIQICLIIALAIIWTLIYYRSTHFTGNQLIILIFAGIALGFSEVAAIAATIWTWVTRGRKEFQ